MDAFVGPLLPNITTGLFARFRSPDGEQAVLEENLFVEQILLGGLEHYLSEEDKAEYRRPYLEPGESRRPTLAWPREVPLGGVPKRNADLVQSYSAWLAEDTRIPKLFIHVVNGALLNRPESLEFVRAFKNQTEVV